MEYNFNGNKRIEFNKKQYPNKKNKYDYVAVCGVQTQYLSKMLIAKLQKGHNYLWLIKNASVVSVCALDFEKVHF